MPLLPLKTQVNANTPLYAPAGSGGGGGGGGPTLTLSTLTFGVGLGTNQTNILSQTNTLHLAGVGDSNFFEIGSQSSNAQLGNQYAVQMVYGSGAYGDITFGDINGANSALTAINAQSSGFSSGNISTFIYGTTQILPSGAPSGAGSQLLVSSILCSTINGAVPGGGGGGSSGGIAVSSITSFPGQPSANSILMAPGPNGNVGITGYPGTTNIAGDIVLDTGISANAITTNFQPGGSANAALFLSPQGVGTQLNMGGTDAGGAIVAAVNATSGNPSTLTIASDNVNFLQPTAAGAPLSIKASDVNLYDIGVPGIATASIGTVGGRNQFYTTRGEVDDCMVSTITAVTGANITALKPLAVSSIVGVSSINGASYPPASSGPTRTQVPSLQGVSVPGTGSATVISADFNPTNGHLYTLTGQVYGQVSQNVGAGSQIMFQIGNNGSVYQAPFPANGLITPFGTNILDVNMTWRHSSAGAERLYCYFWDPVNGANASTFTNAVANMDLIDFGPVA